MQPWVVRIDAGEALADGRIQASSRLLRAAFGAGLTRGAGLIRWGKRTRPLSESDAELAPCPQTALGILQDAIVHTRGAQEMFLTVVNFTTGKMEWKVSLGTPATATNNYRGQPE